MNLKHEISTTAAFILIMFAGINTVYAQDQSSPNTSSTANNRKFSFGIFGGAALVQHVANFPELSGVPVFTPRGDNQEPPNFGSVSSIGFALGILAEYKITPELTVGLRAGYAPQSASFLTSHQRRFGNPNGASELGTIQYSLSTNINTLSAEPFVKYFIWEGLHASLGARVNLALSSSYTQAETLLSPTTGGFTPSFGKVANERSDDAIPELSAAQVAGVLGIGYDLSLGERIIVSPEVSYSLGLTPVVANLSWRVNDLRGGISARLRF